ncbi:peptidylprolyl isomerase [Alteromonas flava]|uniref:peptidylprolyl isomerase n=1 Tax=Alteromonas flava TaxID=2048003 RepID=UPI0013DAB62A|nr:peptidylprolyl isomerase [Alteromonas flava]
MIRYFKHIIQGLGILLVYGGAALVYASEASEVSEETLIPQEQLVYITTDAGLVIIQLTDSVAPNNTQRFRDLVQEGFYDGLDFYRVIDGFVAQAGDLAETKQSAFKSPVNAEFSRSHSKNLLAFEVVQSPEFLAQATGFIDGFPAGLNVNDNRQWLLHCPGAVAMARSNAADSATTEFYIVLGQAPRHLDRNMSIIGQVVYGMQVAQRFHRGDGAKNGGVIDDPAQRTRILSARMGNAVPAHKQLQLWRQNTQSSAFQQRLTNARNLTNPFYHYQGSGNLDVCYYRPSIRVAEHGASDAE